MTAAMTQAPTVELVDRFETLRDVLRGELVDRDREIHGLQVGLVGRLNVLFYGETPGIAKSMLIDRTFWRIGGIRYGHFPMNRQMGLDDLFGPLDARAYVEEGRYRRILDSYLADVEYANLEEIFKTGPFTLGLLYSSLNERRIRNDGQLIDIPLRMIACSSNELPKDDLSGPLYDRIPLRYHVEAIRDRGLIVRMLELDLPERDEIEPVLTGADLEQAQAEARRIPFAPAVSEKLAELYFALIEKGITPTPRRLRWTKDAMQAEAWLDGSDIVAVEHMSIAAHCLWDLPQQVADVADAVLSLANPLERKITQLLEGVGEIRKLLPDAEACTNGEEQQARGMEIFHKVTDAGDELQKIIDLGGTGRRQRDLIESARMAVHEVLVRMITKVMHLPMSEVEHLGISGPAD